MRQGLLALGGSGVLADDYDPKALFAEAPARFMVSEPAVAYAVKRRLAVKPKAVVARRASQVIADTSAWVEFLRATGSRCDLRLRKAFRAEQAV